MSSEQKRETEAIAHRRIWASHPDRGEFAIDVQIGRPYEISANEWACPARVDGLYSNLRDQHGEDSFQALMLAQNLARTLLAHFVEDSGVLLDSPDGKRVDIQKLFGQGIIS